MKSLAIIFVYQPVMYNDISQQWQQENEELRHLSEDITQIDLGLDRMERCLSTEFKLLVFMTQTQHHVNKLYKNPEQFPLNRNSSFMTYDPSRATLGPIQQRQKVQNYINANLIDLQGKKAIATQGPLTVTFYNFWRMVQEYNVNSIFMLCNFIEKTKIKCDRYFPEKDAVNSKLVEKEYQITVLEETEADKTSKKSLKIKKLQLKNTLTSQTKIVTHYQVSDWPDGQIPNEKRKKNIHFLIDQFLNNIMEGSIPVVHCSAGVGRTGTFIAMCLIRQLIRSQQGISIFNVVRKLREQRWGMVHTLTQYEHLYDFAEKEIDRKYNGIASMSSASSEEMDDEL